MCTDQYLSYKGNMVYLNVYNFPPTCVYICILFVKPKRFYVSFLLFLFFFKFYGYIFYEPLRNLIRLLGETKWFKGLVTYAKCNCNSYKSELDI